MLIVCSAVDDFYEDYVTELGTRNSRRLSGKFRAKSACPEAVVS